MNNFSVLVVEDENKLATLMQDYLQREHFDITVIGHGDEVLPWLRIHQPDLILLDIMLPGKDGLTLCREIRQFSNVAIIFITARVEEIDRLLGLELGADDYICKPFSLREMVARVKSVLRRSGGLVLRDDKELVLDKDRMQARVKGMDIGLTAVEYELLKTLYSHPGFIFSRQKLMDKIYADHRIVSNRTIDSHIKKLRKKLAQSDHINSVYGVGYKYEIVPSEEK